MSTHITHITNKIQKIISTLFILNGNTWGINYKKRIDLYKGYIKPSILYGRELWESQINKQNSIQHSILLNSIQAHKIRFHKLHMCLHPRTKKIADQIQIKISTFCIQVTYIRKQTLNTLTEQLIQMDIQDCNPTF